MGKWEGVFVGAEILGICQKRMHRLAARGLPPGASVDIVSLCGCVVNLWFLGILISNVGGKLDSKKFWGELGMNKIEGGME